MNDRNKQIDALIAAASAQGGSTAEATALLVGALTVVCARSSDPVEVLNIVIGSLTGARDLAMRLKVAS